MGPSRLKTIFNILVILVIASSCGADNKMIGDIEITNVVNSDIEKPIVFFSSSASVLTGNQSAIINFSAKDNAGGSGLAKTEIFYSPEPGVVAFKLLGSVPTGSSSFDFCVPNKNHPAPTFKIKATDVIGNQAETTLTGFSINRSTNPVLPGSFSSNTAALTKQNPATFSIDSCPVNSCNSGALSYETPTKQVYTMYNTTATQPLVGDGGWQLCSTALASGMSETFPSDGSRTYSLWVKTIDTDYDATPLVEVSSTSVDQTIEYDNTPPVDVGPANVQFTAFVLEPNDDFDNDGNLIGLSWTSFTDANLANYKISTYTNAACTLNEINHGEIGSVLNNDAVIVNGLTEGQYWAKVTAVDALGSETSSVCSTDSIYVDVTAPVDNGADLQFTDAFSITGNGVAVTWTGFTDLFLTNHRIITYTDSSCTTQFADHGFTGDGTASTSISGLTGTGDFYATVTAYDGVGNSRTSACSTDKISIDTDSPIDNGANLQFTDAIDSDGNNLAVTWVAFTDGNGIGDHRLITFTGSGCTAGEVSHGFTGSGTNSDSAIIDSLADGVYWGKVEAKDTQGNVKLSACSTDSIIVDSVAPVDAPANVQFTAVYTNVNNSTAMTWTAFTDGTLTDHRVRTYTDSGCTTPVGGTDQGLTGSTTNSHTITNILADDEYWVTVTAIDGLGRTTTSGCPSDSVIIDTTNPTDNTANLQFTNAYVNNGDNIAVTWTAFSDINLKEHILATYTDSGCSAGEVIYPTAGTTTNSDSTQIDGLTTGQYWAKVTAVDQATNTTTSACSTDSIIVDTTAPTDNTADVQFTATHDNDGLNVAVTWTAFSDTNAITDHRVLTYTNSACSLGLTTHGLTGSGTASTTITLTEGQYWARVEAFDPALNSTTSVCSTDSIFIDTTAPVDNTANFQFTAVETNAVNNIAATWTAFSDLTLTNHRIDLYTDSGCTTPYDFGAVGADLTGSNGNSDNAIIDGLVEDQYWAKVTAIDYFSRETTSACSTDTVIIDLTNPTENGGGTLAQFDAVLVGAEAADDYDTDGNDIAVSWNAFSDNNTLVDHEITTYTNSGCSVGAVTHPKTGSATNSNATVVDGLADGHYWFTVKAFDMAGNSTTSPCTLDELIVDSVLPAEDAGGTLLTFANTHDIDGNDLDVSWTAFTDLNGIKDYQIITYTNSACSTGAAVHPLIGSNGVTNNTTVDGLADGTYWGRVRAFDNAGNFRDSACSTDSIIVDSTAPFDNTASLQFTLVNATNTDNIAVTWTAFTDLSTVNHRIALYTDSLCTAPYDFGAVGPDLTGSATNSDSVIIDGLVDDEYWGTVTAIDFFGKETTSACSTDTYIVDTTNPTDNTANVQFTAVADPGDDYDVDGNDIPVSWTAFTDLYLSNHRIISYSDSGCSVLVTDHGLTGSNTNTNSTIIDGLTDGHYWVKVTAYDIAGNSAVSACSTDEIIVDTINPTDNTAALQFTNAYNNTGNNVAVTWTAFTDTNGIGDHQIQTFTDSACTLGVVTHPLTGSGTNSDAATIDGLTDGVYYGKVIAYDSAGNSTTSLCSTDFITIDTVAPDEQPIQIIGTVVTPQAIGIYNLSDCSDIAFVQITQGAGSPPAAGAGTWQACDETNYSITYTGLNEGLNALQFWIKDLADNVQTAFIPHNTIYQPPVITVVDGPTISVDTASMTIDICEEAKIKKVLFNETATQPAWNDGAWQTCSKAIGALSYGTLSPGVHTLKTFYMYEDNGPDDADDSNNTISSIPQNVPVTYEPVITWLESPEINRPQISFTLQSCSGITDVKFNQGAQPLDTDPGWIACSTGAGALTYSLTTQGSQSLNIWFKNGTSVYSDFIQKTVNFNPPDGYLFGGSLVSTNSPMLSVNDCLNINRVFVKLDDATATAPSVAEFNGVNGQNCTTAMNAITSPTMGAVEGPHFYDVWFKFTDDYVLDPWYTRINVTYIVNDVTAPPITIGQGADANTTITLTNGDAGGPPETITAFNSRAYYTLNTCVPKAPVALTGTVVITAGTNTVTGTGTLFTTELATGDYIKINGEVIKVVSITNDLGLSLATNHVAGSGSIAATKEYPDDTYTHMILTESVTAPAASDPDWLTCSTTASEFKTKSMTPDGVHNLYAWFKDSSGNVSTSISAQVNVLTAPDVTPPPRPPVIVEGAPTLTSAPAQLTITSCTDVDQVFLEPSDYPSPYVAPNQNDAGWINCTEVVGAIEYSLSIAGSYTISVWFKDTAGNINSIPRDVSFIFDPTLGVFPNPIAYWSMDKVHKRNSKILDIKGDNHLSIWDQANFSEPTGKNAEAIQGTGTNSILITKNDSDLKPTVGVSASMFIYLTNSDASTKGIMGNTEEGVGGYGFKLEASNLKFFASGQSVSIATSTYATGWRHIAGTSDGRYIKIYIDGELKNTTDLGSPANLTYGCSTLFAVGGPVDCTATPVTTNLFDEKIDEVVVWDSYLTDSQMMTHYIDAINGFKVNQDSVAPTDITTITFDRDFFQNAHLTLPDCSIHKFIYLNETTHPPLVDSADWQLCNTITNGTIHPNLIQGPHELKVWAKDEYNNISSGYLKVDTTIEALSYQKPGVLYYNFDNTHLKISEVQDIFSKHHATNVGADTNQVGIKNESFLFTRAESDYVELAYASNALLKDKLTLSLWADLTQGENIKQVLAGTRMAGHGYSLEIDDINSELRFYIESAAGTREVGVSTASYANGFHHILGSYDGQILTLYIDGVLVDTTNFGSVSQITYNCLGSFTIGAGATCSTGPVAGTHFNNNIDEVILWDTAMDSQSVEFLFNGQDSIPPNPVAVTPRNSQYTVGIPLAKFNVSSCSDIGSVYVTLGTATPTEEIPGWQPCATSGDTIKSPQLEAGANTVKFWFKDAAGNVSLTTTDVVITYTHDFTIPTPNSYWTLDDTNIDGSLVFDVSSGKDGNSNNAPNVLTSKVNEGLSLDGLSDYVEVPYNAIFQPASDVTLSAWFKVASYDVSDHVIAGNHNGGGYSLVLGNNTVEFRVEASAATQTASFSTAGLAVDTWHHVAGVWSSGTIRLFVNGTEQVNTVTGAGPSIDYANSNSFLIGAASTTTTGASGSYFDGEVDEVAFWNSALTDTVIAAITSRGNDNDQLWFDVTPPTIPVNLTILYYNSLVSRANLTITDCTGMDYVIVTKDVFPPDSNDEDWQLCNTLTGGILSKELNAGDNYGKLWTKDLFGNISKVFEFVPLISIYDKPVSRPVVHWTFDDPHWVGASQTAFDRISQIDLKSESLKNTPEADADCRFDQVSDPDSSRIITGVPGVQFEGFNFNTADVKYPGFLRSDHPNNSKLKPTEKLSVGVWVYLQGSIATDDKHIVSNEVNGKGWSIHVSAANVDDNGLRFTVHTAAGTLEPYLETKNYTTGWHYVVGTYDGQVASLFFDGIFVKSFTNLAPSPIVYEPGVNTFVGAQASTTNLPTRWQTYFDSGSCGAMNDTTGYPNNSYYREKIDEIIIWDKVLSKLEVSSLYHNGADILYDTDSTPPANPTLALENTEPEMFANKAYFTVNSCNDISGVLVNEGTQPDKQDARWEICRTRLGSFGLENLSSGGHTITAWFKDLAGNVTPISSDLVVDYIQEALPSANASWPLDSSHNVSKYTRDVIGDKVHDLMLVNIDTPLNPGATQVAGKVNEGLELASSAGTNGAYLSASSTKLLRPVNYFSVGGWFYLTQNDAGSKVLIDHHDFNTATDRGGYRISIAGGNLTLTTELDIEDTEAISVATNSYTTGWHHVIGVFTGWELQLYIDGVVQGTRGPFAERDFIRYDAATITNLHFGAESNQSENPSNFFGGKVDELGVWGFDLSAAQVLSIKNAGDTNTHFYTALPAPSDMDNAFIYFYDNFGSRARMTILDCTNTPFVYVQEQGNPAPTGNLADWRHCRTEPGAILSEKLDLATTYVDVYTKNSDGVVSTVAGTKEILPILWDHDLVLPITYFSYNTEHFSGTTNHDFIINSRSNDTATPSRTPNNDGDALALDGSTQYSTIGGYKIYDLRHGLTISFWADITNGDGGTKSFISRTGGDIDDTQIMLSGGNLVFTVNTLANAYDRTTTQPSAAYSTSKIATGRHFITASYDGYDLRLYLDGILVDQENVNYRNYESVVFRKIEMNSISGFRVGYDGTNFYPGEIDELMIFDRVLTETELNAWYFRYKHSLSPGDSTAPATVPNLSVAESTFGTNWPTIIPNPIYKIDNCTDIAGVFINLDGAPAPAWNDAGWQNCDTGDGHLTSPTLTAGTHTVQFWYKDSYGNVTSSSQNIVVDYTIPATPDPVAYWSFDDEQFFANKVYEPINQLHAYIFGGSVTAGKVNDAVSLDGTRKYLEVEHSAIIKPTEQISVSAWVNIPADYADRLNNYVFSNRGDSAEGMIMRWSCTVTCTTTNQADIQFLEFIINLNGSDYVLDIPQAQVGSGWKHFIYTFDSRYIKMYINGVLRRTVDTGAERSITYNVASNTSLILGGDATDSEQPVRSTLFPGSLDEFAIYNVSLNQAQVTDIYSNFANNNTRIYDPSLPIITPVDANISIFDPPPGNKPFGSRLRLTLTSCTNTDMILVSNSAASPLSNDPEWQPCNTLEGGILSGPMPAGAGLSPKVWARTFTGTVSASFGTPTNAPITMPSFLTDIPRPQVHWSLNSAASGYTSGNNIYDSLGQSHGLLDATNPPESTTTSGDTAAIEKGYYFNGVDEFISIHPTSSTNPMYDASISAWAELKRGENLHRHIVGNYQNLASPSGGGIGLRIYQGELQFYVNTWTGTTSVLSTVGFDTNIYTDGMHHIAGTYDGRDLKLFLDGVLVNTYSIQFYGASRYEIYHDDRSSWTIGAESNGVQTAAAGSFFSGVIDDIRLWHTPLTEQQVYYAYEYGSDYLPLNLSDGTPPTDPGILVTGNKTITETPYAYFTMPTCTGANGVEVNAIFVNLLGDPDPLEDDLGWQYCSVDSGFIISKLLDLGVSTVQIWFRDEEGDISPVPTTYSITYTPPTMFNPFAYYTFDAADRGSINYYLDRANNFHIRNSSYPYSPITTGKVGDAFRRGSPSLPDNHYPNATERSYVTDFNIDKNYSYSFWYYPLDAITVTDSLISTGQFSAVRTNADAIRAYTGGGFQQSTGRVKPSQWNHVGVTRNNGVLKIFLNGFLDSVHGIGNGNLALNKASFTIGNVDGVYDELALFDKELTDDQMLHLYWKGQNNLNIDTFRKERVPASIPDHYWNFDTASFTDPTLSDLTGGVDLTKVNNVTSADADAKVGESFSFSRFEHNIDAGNGEGNALGNKEYLETSNAAQIALSGDFTYSLWVKQPSPTGFAGAGGHADSTAILDQWGPEEQNQSFQLTYARSSGTSYSASIRVGGGAGGLKTISTTWDSFSTNTGWNHIAVKRSGVMMEMFVNGVLSGFAEIGGGTVYTPNLKTRFRVGESSLYNWYRQNGTVSVSAGTSIVTGVGTAFETDLTNAMTGTVTIGAGTSAVSGVGTLFSTELTPGDRIRVNSEWAEVLSIADNLNMTLVAVHAAGATGDSYVRQSRNDLRFGDYDGETHQLLTIDSDTQVTLATNHVLGVSSVVYDLNSSIGNGVGSDEYGFNGKLDEVAIWYKALGHEQIWDLYQKGNAASAISTEPLVSPNLSGTTTSEVSIGLTLSDCKTYTHVWVGFSTDLDPLTGDGGWVACDTAVGALQSKNLVVDAINIIRVWFKTGAAGPVSSWTTDTTVTQVSGDTTPPTPPTVTEETSSPTTNSFARYTLSTCADIAGVFVNHSSDPAPLKNDSGWVTCNTINSSFLSPALNPGANTISFYFKDAAGNVTTSSDYPITYNQPTIPSANLHFNFDLAQTTNKVLRDSIVRASAIGKNRSNIITGGTGVSGEAVSFSTNAYFESWNDSTYPTNALTFSAWVNLNAPATDSLIYGHWDNSSANDGLAIRIDNSGRLCLDFQTANSTGAWNSSSYRRICSVDKIDFATYQHIAIRKSSGTVNFYINNVPVGTETIDTGNFFATTLPYRIGAQDQGGTTSPVSGSIDELAIWNSTLSLVELEAVYAQGLRGNALHQEMQAQAPPIPSYYYNMDNTHYESTTAKWLDDVMGSIDVQNIASITPTEAIAGGGGQVNESISFANENKFVSAATSVNMGTQFAISAWINISSEDDQSTIINRWGVADADREFRLYTDSRYLKFDYHTTATDTFGAVGYDTITSINQIPLSTWTHVMVTRKNDDLRIYINGSLEAGKLMGTDPILDVASLPLIIGGEDAGAANWFSGSIDEVGIYKKSMEERQVRYLYDRGVANTVLPTDTVVTVAHASSTVGITPANLTIGDCQGYAKMISKDSGAAVPAATDLVLNCSESIGAHQTSALPATADTVDVYLGDGASVVHGTNYPVGVIYAP